MKTVTSLSSFLFLVLSAYANLAQAEQVDARDPAGGGSVEVSVEGLASDEGLLYVSLFISADGFPGQTELAFANRSVPADEATDGSIVLKFASVPAGRFAVSVLHDTDRNGKLSKNFLGIPKEDYGFSQNPKSTFGPPPFSKAAMTLAAGEAKRLVVKMK
jgi:uncharacterized protein (DUF2141 family)